MPLDLTGLMVAQVTPFGEGGAGVDLDWLPAHIAWLEGQGVSSILTLGTNGEGPSVGLTERRRVVEAVVAQRDALGGGLGVVAGAGCLALPDTIRAANEALDAGADAVALLPSHFYDNTDAAGQVHYFSSVIEALPSQARVLLYNIPPRTKMDIADEVVLALLELFGEQVIGIKDSCGDVARTQRYIDATADVDSFVVLAGADHVHAELYAAGCGGGVSGMANAVPALAIAIQSTFRRGGDAGRAQRQLNVVKDMVQAFQPVGALKSLIGITSGLPVPHCRPPNRDLSPQESAAFEEAIGRFLAGAPA